jgi:hypothetical protein
MMIGIGIPSSQSRIGIVYLPLRFRCSTIPSHRRERLCLVERTRVTSKPRVRERHVHTPAKRAERLLPSIATTIK